MKKAAVFNFQPKSFSARIFCLKPLNNIFYYVTVKISKEKPKWMVLPVERH